VRAFEPLLTGFKVIPYGDARALRQAITADTCAFLVEPIQGEGGSSFRLTGISGSAVRSAAKRTSYSSSTRYSRDWGGQAACSHTCMKTRLRTS